MTIETERTLPEARKRITGLGTGRGLLENLTKLRISSASPRGVDRNSIDASEKWSRPASERRLRSDCTSREDAPQSFANSLGLNREGPPAPLPPAAVLARRAASLMAVISKA